MYLLAKPYERGFFCDDESLRHPFQGDTVPMALLIPLGFIIPLLAVSLTDFLSSLKKWTIKICRLKRDLYIGKIEMYGQNQHIN
jgi:hypothetical protein